MPSPLTAVPPGRAARRGEGAPRRRRRGRPGRDPRPVAPDPRQPRSRVRGAPGRGLGRRGPRAPRLRGRARRPARLATAIRAIAPRRPGRRRRRGSGSSPSTTRCPDSATAAATTRWRRPGVGAAIALAAIADELPGEIVFLGTPAEERGSGKADHDRGRPLRGDRRGAPLPPLRPQPRRVASRSRRRTSTSSSAGSRPTRRPTRGRAATRSTR